MTNKPAKDKRLTVVSSVSLPSSSSLPVPSVIESAGKKAKKRFIEFFTANIRNANTRDAYARTAVRFFSWCEMRSLELGQIEPFHVASYIEQMSQMYSPASIKRHLAGIKMLFDFLVIGQIVPGNPAAIVRGPKHSVTKGSTSVLSAKDMRRLFDAIDVTTVAGLRDRALIGLMVYSFARVSAAVNMKKGDYLQKGSKEWVFRLHEKGGKRHEVPAHHKAQEYLDAYIKGAGLENQHRKAPLFRSFDYRNGPLTDRPLTRTQVTKMVKRRARSASLNPERISAHSFRGTGITIFLENGGLLENAQRIAAHADARTTKGYDHSSDTIEQGEIERVRI